MWLTASWLGAAARWVAFSGTALVIGVVAARASASGWPDPPAAARAHRVARSAAVAVLAAALLRLAQQALAFAAAPEEAWSMVGVLLGMPWGWAWCAQLAAATLVMVKPGLVAGGTRYVAGSVCALALAATPAFHGHAFGAPEYRLQAVAADVAHVVASGLWVGTLAVLAVTWFPRGTPAQVARVVPRFSGMALIGAAVLGATGVFAGWLHVRTVDLLFASSYGWLLLAKVAAVGVTAGIGAYNWKRVTPRLHEQAGVWRLRRSALAEVLVAALALALTAVLVATALPGE